MVVECICFVVVLGLFVVVVVFVGGGDYDGGQVCVVVCGFQYVYGVYYVGGVGVDWVVV